jgi:hypothetical protein
VFAVLVSVLVFKISEASLAGLVGSIPIHFRFSLIVWFGDDEKS